MISTWTVQSRGFQIALHLLLGLAIWQCTSGLYIYAKAEIAQYLISKAWHQTKSTPIQNRSGIQPWSWADTWPVARLVFPDSEKELMVLSGASPRTLAFGPGHLNSSTQPGKTGNTVIVGHRDTHFSVLEELQHGQRVLLESANGVTVEYRVTDTMILDETQTQVLGGSDTAMLTLITCYPFKAIVPGGRLRYVVIAEPV